MNSTKPITAEIDDNRLAVVSTQLTNTQLMGNVVLHLTLTHAWNPIHGTFNIPSWALSVLMFFYLIFPGLASILGRSRAPWKLLFGVLLLYPLLPLLILSYTKVTPVIHGFLHNNPLVRLPEFICGMLLSLVLSSGLFNSKRKVPGWAGFAIVMLFTFIVVLGFLLYRPELPAYYLSQNGLLLPVQLALVGLISMYSSISNKNVSEFATRLGASSIVIFLVHIPIGIIFIKVINYAEKYLIQISGAGDIGSFLLGFIISMLNSGWFYLIYIVLVIFLSMVINETFVRRIKSVIQVRFEKI